VKPFVHRHRVHGAEVDNQAFVFNSRYFEIADDAMTELLRGLGWPFTRLRRQRIDPSVVSTTATFRAPARLDDLVDVTVECLRVGTSSFALKFTMTRGTATLCVIETTYVNVDAAEARSCPLPEEFAVALRERQVSAHPVGAATTKEKLGV